MAVKMIHKECRSGVYPRTTIKRFILKDNELDWNINLTNYNPPEYNSPFLKNKLWADPDLDDPNFKPIFNEMDNGINRKSYMGIYKIFNERPLNIMGRTGLMGRGILGKWGPNHAGDCIVTRWKRINNEKQFHSTSKLPILQFCAIQRKDTGEWAIPGGMINPKETSDKALKREFLEEVLNILDNNNKNVEEFKRIIDNFFIKGIFIYQGYVDDHRNTDNAWIETYVMNYHDENDEYVNKLKIQAGDDAANANWLDIDKNLTLYASHSNFIEIVAKKYNCHY